MGRHNTESKVQRGWGEESTGDGEHSQGTSKTYWPLVPKEEQLHPRERRAAEQVVTAQLKFLFFFPRLMVKMPYRGREHARGLMPGSPHP